MERFTTFNYSIDARPSEDPWLWQHAGASRFAYNQGIRFVSEALENRKTDSDVKVPWSSFDLINAFNAWKKSSAAGVDENGSIGLHWRDSVCAQVFEEGLVDLAKGLKGFSDSKKGKRCGKKIGFPKLKKKFKSRPSFRIRNKLKKNGLMDIRIDDRTIHLPKIGSLKINDDTRKLRQLLKGGARVMFATISFDGKRWRVALNVKAGPLHPKRLHQCYSEPVGIDRGLKAFIVVADKQANEIERVVAPKPLSRSLKILRRRNKTLSRKKKLSKNFIKAKCTLRRTHARITNVRRDFIQKLSTKLVKNHDNFVIESLNIAGLIRNPKLARHIADASWGDFGRMLEYKAIWHTAKLEQADRFFASTQTCSQCHRKRKIPLELSDRVFTCEYCEFTADRDVNAAACLANMIQINLAAAKRSEALNACGEESSGSMRMASLNETGLCEAGTLEQSRGTREGWCGH